MKPFQKNKFQSKRNHMLKLANKRSLKKIDGLTSSKASISEISQN
jgi:hypothetical protein